MSPFRLRRSHKLERLCDELAARLASCKTSRTNRLSAYTEGALADLEDTLRKFLDDVHSEDAEYEQPDPRPPALRVIQGGAA